MTIGDRIADKMSSGGWWLENHKPSNKFEYKSATVAFGKDLSVVVECSIADTQEKQVVGLQRHADLGNSGMVFPYESPRHAQFHMGDVQFPIDIIFVGSDSRVTKIVANVEPGTRGHWGMPHTAMVVETRGGFCADNHISVNTPVFQVLPLEKSAASKYKPAFRNRSTGEIKTLDRHWEVKDDPQLLGLLEFPGWTELLSIWEDGYLDAILGEWLTRSDMANILKAKGIVLMEDDRATSEDVDEAVDRGLLKNVGGDGLPRTSQEEYTIRRDIDPPMVCLPDSNSKGRFKGRDTVDVQLEGQPMDGKHYKQTMGNDPTRQIEMSDGAPTKPG